MMIYTVTFNPSLDYIVSVSDFKPGLTNRTKTEQLLPGGKGINVSTVLSHLGIENTALGFVAGFTGDELERRLEALGVRTDFIRLEEGFTRINVKLKSIDGTEINGQGPKIHRTQAEALMRKLDRLQTGDILVLAGSIPASMPETAYETIMARLDGKGIRIVVDAERQLLRNVLKYHPFLVKPNHHELGAIFGVKLATREAVVPYAGKLQAMGADNVLVSLGGAGAVLLTKDGHLYQEEAPKGRLVNSVGAGDSMVAGFLAGWMATEGRDAMHAFKMGIAAGSASAFSENLATRSEIENIFRTVSE